MSGEEQKIIILIWTPWSLAARILMGMVYDMEAVWRERQMQRADLCCTF